MSSPFTSATGKRTSSTSSTPLAISSEAPIRSGTIDGKGPLVLVHGGAWDIPDEEVAAHEEGLDRALRVGRRALERGGLAIDIVTEVVAALEDHPAFDAGRGSVLDRDGLPQLDAGLMEGSALRWGAVANVRQLHNPIRAARALVDADGQARLLVGDGAERFAAEQGIPACEPTALILDRERERYERLRSHEAFHTSAAFAGAMDVPRGTVGCVVRDEGGRLAAATSTGGAPMTRPGRVGDSAIPGAGFLADASGAVSATGWGEAILTVQVSAQAVAGLQASQTPEAAAAAALATLRDRVQWTGAALATGGLILLDRLGRAGWAYSTPRMARGAWRPGAAAWVSV